MKTTVHQRIVLLFCTTSILISCTSSPNANQNQLKYEKSPYLLQHKHNPIWWQAWASEGLDYAEKKQQLIFLSIGYSTCHWCHVMERESFENAKVAETINGRFLPIKADREERPDIDKIYMSAVQAMTGSGGWPLTLVLTPDRKPIFGATYIPRKKLINLLNKIHKIWETEPEKIKQIGENLMQWFEKSTQLDRIGKLTPDIFLKFLEQQKSRYDAKYGGYKRAPKFPPSYALRMLLRIHRRHQDPDILNMINNTLKNMAHGGIYDHLMGGFHRYSTDKKWIVPHFEKMLYDQSALALLYLEAFQVTGNIEYSYVVREILDYVLREMMQKQGGFYSAQDADSEGHEGLFAVWKWTELKSQLTKAELQAMVATYGVSEDGNFEGKNILVLNKKASRKSSDPILTSAMGKLRAIRLKRIQPIRDDKLITGWNGLMISAFSQAGRVLKVPKYLRAAQISANFIWSHLRKKNGELYRRWIRGEAKHPAMLSDYAFFIDGLIELYQSSFEVKWYDRALALQNTQDEIFWSKPEKFYYSSDGKDPSLIHRPKEFYDNVRPAGNSVALLNLLRLYDLSQNKVFRTKATEILQNKPSSLLEQPSPFPYLLMALDYEMDRSKEVAIVALPGEGLDIFNQLVSDFQPNRVFSLGLGSSPPLLKDKVRLQSKTTIYICESGLCQLPVTDVAAAKLQLSTHRQIKTSK